MSYGLNVLPCQEKTDKLESIELKIGKEGLTESQIEELECFLNAHMDLYAKHDRYLGDTSLITR